MMEWLGIATVTGKGCDQLTPLEKIKRMYFGEQLKLNLNRTVIVPNILAQEPKDLKLHATPKPEMYSLFLLL